MPARPLYFSVPAVVLCLVCCASSAHAGSPRGHFDSVATGLLASGLRECEAHAMLRELTAKAPHRLSGSAGAARAVQLTKRMMEDRGFDRVRLETVMVPRWVRGPVEQATMTLPRTKRGTPLSVCALGGSIATPPRGIEAEVVEVRSFEELKSIGEGARGKIVFFNRPFDPTKMNTFEAYGGAVDQRSSGAIEAAKAGGVAALVRSMTLALDDAPHTGGVHYADSVARVPAAAISTVDANMLSALLSREPGVMIRLKLSCTTLPDVESANVLGEITGAEKPNEVIVVGGHLDSWDKGAGAHDDGGGCVQAIEAVNLIKKLGLKPKRTIRAVMFMNEENGLRGGRGYPVAPGRKGEKQIAAVESDRGVHTPRGFTVHGDSSLLAKVTPWQPYFEKLEAGRIRLGYSGVDVMPTVESGAAGFGLDVDTHRYFDYHHSDNDTFDKVHPREIELGAIVEALLCYLISEEGLEGN